MLDGDDSTQGILIDGFNEMGFLRASIKRMELSQMRSSEAVSDALEELEKIEFCVMLLKYKSTIAADTITLMLNNCEALRVFMGEPGLI
jgi:hypothetical protein